MQKQKKRAADRLYLVLAGIFITTLVTCNLIFLKFFEWQPLGELSDFTFKLSVGVLPYPVTFLVTDMLSEFYGQKKANRVVFAGLVSSVFMVLLVYLANWVPAADFSPVNDATFNQVFSLAGPAVAASLLAYLAAQLIDIRIYDFWKNYTKGKHLWLRNNFSTMTSQLVDSTVVITLLCLTNSLDWADWGELIWYGWLFKVLAAAIDTPILYGVTAIVRNYFGLKVGQELNY